MEIGGERGVRKGRERAAAAIAAGARGVREGCRGQNPRSMERGINIRKEERKESEVGSTDTRDKEPQSIYDATLLT